MAPLSIVPGRFLRREQTFYKVYHVAGTLLESSKGKPPTPVATPRPSRRSLEQGHRDKTSLRRVLRRREETKKKKISSIVCAQHLLGYTSPSGGTATYKSQYCGASEKCAVHLVCVSLSFSLFCLILSHLYRGVVAGQSKTASDCAWNRLNGKGTV